MYKRHEIRDGYKLARYDLKRFVSNKDINQLQLLIDRGFVTPNQIEKLWYKIHGKYAVFHKKRRLIIPIPINPCGEIPLEEPEKCIFPHPIARINKYYLLIG